MHTDPQADLDAEKQRYSYLRSKGRKDEARASRGLIERLEKEVRSKAKEAADQQAGQQMLGFADTDEYQQIRLTDVSLIDPREGLDAGDVCNVVEYDEKFPCVMGLVTMVALLRHEWEEV